MDHQYDAGSLDHVNVDEGGWYGVVGSRGASDTSLFLDGAAIPRRSVLSSPGVGDLYIRSLGGPEHRNVSSSCNHMNLPTVSFPSLLKQTTNHTEDHRRGM